MVQSIASLSRRAALVGGVALAAPLTLAACGGKPNASSKGGLTKLRFGAGSAAVAACTAKDAGVFERNGLDVELMQIQSGPSAVAATVGGALDFTFGDFLGWVSAVVNGFTNCSLVAPANGNGNLAVISKPGLDRPQQLAGKRLGVSPAPVFSLSVRLWLAQIGVDPGSVQLVLMGQGAEHALGRGDIDALLAFDPVVYRAGKLYGARAIAGDPTEAVMPSGASRACYYVNGDFLKAHPDIVERTVASLHEGARLWAAASPREKARIVSPSSGLTIAQMEAEMPGLVESFRHPPAQLTAFDVPAAQAWVDIAVQDGAVARRIDIKPFVYRTALEAA